MAKWHPYLMSGHYLTALLARCPPNEYRVLKPDELPSGFPITLVGKTDSVVLVNSGNLFMVDFHRVDKTEIDHLPFGFIYQSGPVLLSGGFLDHASFQDRTVPATQDFLNIINASGIGNATPFSGMPMSSGGTLSSLNQPYHLAFQALERRLSGCLAGLTSGS